jgi:hypothetical protein
LAAQSASWDGKAVTTRPAQLLLLFPVPELAVVLTLLAVNL